MFSHFHVHLCVDSLYLNHVAVHFVQSSDWAVKLSTLCPSYVELHTGQSIVIGWQEFEHHPFHQFVLLVSFGSHVSHASKIPSQQYGFIAEQSTHFHNVFSHFHVHVCVDSLYLNHVAVHFVQRVGCAVKLSTLCPL